jgi:hypothetical protein
MFPIRWSHPPWRNIEEKNGVTTSDQGSRPSRPSMTLAGINAYAEKNRSRSCCAIISKRKTTTFAAIRATVTAGKLPEGFRSRSGIMERGRYPAAISGRAR